MFLYLSLAAAKRAYNDSQTGTPGEPLKLTRRDTLKFATVAAPILTTAPTANSEHADGGIKIAVKIAVPTITDDELLFLKQIGLGWLHADFVDAEPSFDYIKSTQERFDRYGLRIHCALSNTYRSKKIQLGQPGRDKDIERFNTFLQDCGRLRIPTSHIDFHPGNTYTTSMITTPRGYKVRQFDLSDFRNRVEKQMYEREYSADDIWSNYTYFLRAVLPEAEKAGVLLAHHPDDPPLAKMNGVAKVFINYAGYKHAEDVAAGGSKNWGLCLCVGTWLEGGDTMGKDVLGMINDFGGRGKIFTVHFRNVSSPLPRFHETFQDDGYRDMYKVMKALRQVRSNASLIPDHYPELAGDANRRMANAYMISQMRTLLRRAEEEVG